MEPILFGEKTQSIILAMDARSLTILYSWNELHYIKANKSIQ